MADEIEKNIVYAHFPKGCHEIITDPLYQYDYGQILKVTIEGEELPEAYEVDFSNERINGETTTQIGNDNGVTVPDIYLTTGKYVFAFIMLHEGENDGETEYVIVMPVSKRSRRTNQEPTPVQQDVISEAIAALQYAVSETAENVALTAQYADDAEAYMDAAEDFKDQAEGFKNDAETQAGLAEGYSESASGSATEAERQAGLAEEYADNASGEANRAKDEADRAEDAVAHNPTIISGTWWVWDPGLNAYVDTGVHATGDKGNVMFATFEVLDGWLNMFTDPEYSGANFAIENAYLEVII